MAQNSIRQLQHYVPRFLLRRFGSGKKNHLQVFDKHTGKTFERQATKLAAENGLYDFEFRQQSMTIEPSLAKLEGRAASHIRRIVEKHQLHLLNSFERSELAGFFAVQLVRTRAHLETMRHFSKTMETYLRQEGFTEFFSEDPDIGSGDNAERATMAMMITNAPKDFGPALAEKDWALLQSDRNHPFLIGDHPLTMFNSIDRVLRGNLGLTVKGIECYFPLAPNLALAMWCPSHHVKLTESIKMVNENSEVDPRILPYSKNIHSAHAILEAIDTGRPLMGLPENVQHFNSLQIVFAERFLFSSNGDFELVKDMLSKDPELRRGRRLKEASGKF